MGGDDRVLPALPRPLLRVQARPRLAPPPRDPRGILPALRRHHLHGKRGGDGQPDLFIKGHVTGAGMVKEANLIDSICFYWFAYLFANLIWVFVPIPLIWKATADILTSPLQMSAVAFQMRGMGT